MKPSKIYTTLTLILLLACVLNQHFVHSDLWERHPNNEQMCPQDLIVKQFVRKLLLELPNIDLKQSADNIEESLMKADYHLYIALSMTEHKVLHEFVNSHANFDDVVDVLSHMVKSIVPHNNNQSADSTEYFSDPIQMYFLIALSLVVATTFLLNLFTTRRIWRLIIVTFFINIMWNWFYLYEEEKSKTLYALQSGIPSGCLLNQKPFGTQILEWFTIQKDDCQTYIGLVTINPLFRVRPYEALSISVTNIIFRPFQYCGQYLSTFIREISAPLPFYMQPFMIILLFIIFVVLVLILNNYSFSTHFLSITKNYNKNNNNNEILNRVLEKLDNLENKISNQDQLEDIQVLLKKFIKDSEDSETLNHVNKDLHQIAGGDSLP